MSIVVGWATGTDVFIAADSVATDVNGHIITQSIIPKIGQCGEAIFGCAGPFGNINIMRKVSIDAGDDTMDIYDHLLVNVVPSLRLALQNDGLTIVKNGQTKMPDGSGILIGIKGRLFVLLDMFTLIEPIRKWAAIGSGSQVASGALSVLEADLAAAGSVATRVEDLLYRTVEATISCVTTTRGPVVHERTRTT